MMTGLAVRMSIDLGLHLSYVLLLGKQTIWFIPAESP